ncbi:thioredoxin [Chromatiales bacterium (ex Bugula neritina AB1)]|nr:thioredoxin [Chromatiales bacterium (ex Bugula neritina AB1)]
MSNQKSVSRSEWLEARRVLLSAEKQLQRQRDAVSELRRELPWVLIDQPYQFQSTAGPLALADLFGPHSQLIVQHFMMGEDWDGGCPSCSLWADCYDGTTIHLEARDTAFVAVSNAPLDKILQYKQQMGWNFNWVSANGSTFNKDFNVSFSQEQRDAGPVDYNFRPTETSMDELPGISVFAKDESNAIYHTYSCYSRGLDNMNSIYQYLDLLPKGRDEDKLDYPMAWVRRHNQYE